MMGIFGGLKLWLEGVRLFWSVIYAEIFRVAKKGQDFFGNCYLEQCLANDFD